MNDLNQLLRDAADGDHGGPGDRLDPRDLLSSGRRKVRNRRIAVAGAVTAVVVAVAAVVTFLPDDDGPEVVNTPKGDATYERVPVSPREAVERCTRVLNIVNDTEGVEYATSPPPAEPPEGVTFQSGIRTAEGIRLRFYPASAPDADPERCVIPQVPLIDGIAGAREEPVPEVDDDAAIADLCSRRVGYDVSGWDVVVAVELAGGIRSMLMASNGYFTHCALRPDGDGTIHLDETPRLNARGEPRGTDEEITIDRRPDEVVDGETPQAVKYGVLPGLPDGYQVVARGAAGRTLASTSTSNGAYVLVYPYDQPDTVWFAVRRPDGTRVATSYIPASSGGL